MTDRLFLSSFDTLNLEKLLYLHLQFPKISAFRLVLVAILFQHSVVGAPLFILPDSSAVETIEKANISSKTDTLTTDSLAENESKEDGILPFPIKYHANDSMRVDVDSQLVYLFGKASVDYDDLHLTADLIRIDMNLKEVAATGRPDSTGQLAGKPEFSQAEQKFKATSMRYNFGSKKGKISYVITSEGDGYIHGETVKKDAENNFFIKNGQYTTCNLDEPHFSISASKLKVIKNDKIVTGPAYLTIEDIPTPLAIPFGFFPNKKGRSSGVVFPGFGESTDRGFYFQRMGYYFGFSDYFNLMLTTDLYTKGSYTIDLSSQYKKRYKYSGNFKVSYAYTKVGERDLPNFSSRRDFHINWLHTQDPKANPYSNFSANVSAGSSQYYRNTIAPLNNYLSNTFQSSLSWTKLFPDKPINLTLSMNHWQNTITHDVRINLPDVSFGVARFTPFKRKVQQGKVRWYEKIGGNYTMRGTNYVETKDSLLFSANSLQQMKNGIQHVLPFSTSLNLFKFITVSPSINYTERWYFKTTEYQWNNELRKVDTLKNDGFKAARDYSISVGMLTRIYGMFQYKRGPVAAIRHVLTPSVGLSYRPDFSEAHYGYYRKVQTDTNGTLTSYSIFQNTVFGGPAAGKYGAMTFSLDNNLEMKVRVKTDSGMTLKKIKLLESLRFNSSYNLIADSMKLSPITFSGRTTLANKFILTFGGTLDPYAFDALNRDYNKFQIDENGRLFRLTSASTALNFNDSTSV